MHMLLLFVRLIEYKNAIPFTYISCRSIAKHKSKGAREFLIMADEFDGCECIWSHELAMQRLINFVSGQLIVDYVNVFVNVLFIFVSSTDTSESECLHRHRVHRW